MAGAITSAKVGANALATPHLANQGILSASIGAGVIGTPHLRDGAITSALMAASVLATPHLANQGILSASLGANVLATPHLANQGILSASLGANVLATPHLANQGILSAALGANVIATPHIAAGGILSGALGAGTQDLALVGFRRPMVELGTIIISGTWNGTPQSINIPSGYTALEVLATMLEVPTVAAGDVRMQFSAQSGGIYHTGIAILGTSYSFRTLLSANSFYLLTSSPAGVNRLLGRASIQSLAGNRHCAFSEIVPMTSGMITSANMFLERHFGYMDSLTTLSGLTFWSVTSGAYASGSVIKVFSPTY